MSRWIQVLAVGATLALMASPALACDGCLSWPGKDVRAGYEGEGSRTQTSTYRTESAAHVRIIEEDGRTREGWFASRTEGQSWREEDERSEAADCRRSDPGVSRCRNDGQWREVSLPGSFFLDAGGVGPAFLAAGGGGGGGVFVGGSASASASVRASASVSVSVSGHVGGGHGGHSGGCGCGHGR